MKKLFAGIAINIQNTIRKSCNFRTGYITCLLLFVCYGSTFAQQLTVRATASLDTNSIRIGEQVHLDFDVVASKEAQVFFPLLPDTMHHLEVLERSTIDTIKTDDDNSVNYRQQIIITCFEPGIYLLQPFKFMYRYSANAPFDSVATEALMLQVETVEIDTAQAIKDIKPPVDVPFTFREAVPYIIGVIIIAAIILLIVYLIKKRKQKHAEIQPKVPSKPPHEIALEALKKLQEQKLWQQGFYKEYQSEVSDTIRNYIEQYFTVPALELTSDETLERLKRKKVPVEAVEKLTYIFQLADMVKFAKSVPLGTENELSMQYAIDFVMLTKPVTIDDFNEQGEQKEVKG